MSKRGLFGERYRVKQDITVNVLVAVSHQVIRGKWEVVWEQSGRNGVELIWDKAHFEGPDLLQITRDDEAELFTADKFVIAVGTRPAPMRCPSTRPNCTALARFGTLGKYPRA